MRKVSLSLFCVLFLLLCCHVWARTQVIEKITITGNKIITTSEIEQLIPLKVGDSFDPQKMEQAFSYLKKWGRFSTITVEDIPSKRGVEITVHVQEGVAISGIDIRGTYPYLSSRIRRLLSVHTGELFEAEFAKEQTEKIQAFYERHGYYNTQVSLKTRLKPKKGVVDLKYHVDKGDLYRIEDIKIHGATQFTHGYFVSQINPLISYNAGRLRKSLEKIKKDYQKKGFLSVKVRLLNLNVDNAKKTVSPEIDITEGRKILIHFAGNHSVSPRTMKKIVPLYTEGGSGTYEIELSKNNILNHYHQLGFNEATVESSQKIDQEELHITFKIHEGIQTRVKSLKIIGNESIPDKPLQERFLTKENTIFQNGYYQPYFLQKDSEELKKSLNLQGAPAGQVLQAESISNHFKDKVAVNFRIQEGPVTVIERVQISGNSAIKTEELQKNLKTKEGGRLVLPQLEADKQALILLYANHGFPYATIEHELSQSILKLTIHEGPLTKIKKIFVSGNERTLKKSIQDMLLVKESENFNYKKILESERLLRSTGSFRSVKIETIGLSEQAPEVNLIVHLEEYRSLLLDLGVTYNTDQHFTSNLTLTDLNILGSIKRSSLSLTAGQEILKGELIFKDPNFFREPFLTGSLAVRMEKQIRPGFKIVEGGGSLSVLKEFTPRFSLLGRYEIIRTFFSDVVDEVGAEEEDHTIAQISTSLSYDTRDSFSDPKNGFLATVGTDISTKFIASNFNYINPKISFAHYFDLGGPFTLLNNIRAETIFLFGNDELSRDQKLYLGGDYSVRGFEEDRLGPIGSDDRPTGGKLSLLYSAELQAKLVSNFRLGFFFDTGSLTENISDVSLTTLRQSAGIGLRYITPLGPIRLDYGIKLDKHADESFGRLHFAFGYTF